MTKRADLNTENEMSFLDHLEILRWHLIRSIVAVIILAAVAFIFHDFIFDKIIFAPKSPEFWTNRMFCKFGTYIGTEILCINSIDFEIYNINFAGQFSTHIIVSLVLGVILSFPYIFWEMWRFIQPALYDKEKRSSKWAIVSSSSLFISGVLFGYYIITPLTVHFLGSYEVSSNVNNEINLNSYISTLTSVVLAAGIIFELPVLIYFLAKVGIISSDFLKKYRKHAIVVILALAAIITPPDVFSQLLVCLPLLFLYQIGIGIAKRIEKKRNLELSSE